MNRRRDSPGMCSYVWALLLCWASEDKPCPCALLRVRQPGPWCRGQSNFFHFLWGTILSFFTCFSEFRNSPLYKFYLLRSNTKIWTDQRKTWLLVSNLNLLFQTPTSFTPITNFVPFGSGLTHHFSRFFDLCHKCFMHNTFCMLTVILEYNKLLSGSSGELWINPDEGWACGSHCLLDIVLQQFAFSYIF